MRRSIRQWVPKRKRRVIRRRECLHLELQREQVAEFADQPVVCRQACRMVVVRENISPEKGEAVLFEEVRFFFNISKVRAASAAERGGKGDRPTTAS